MTDGTAPATRVIERATVADTGLWIDEVHGIYASVRLVDIAMARGWQPPNEDDAEVIEWARRGRYVEDEDTQAHMDACWAEIEDEALEWLNQHVAPEGASFCWEDGNLFLFTDEQWCGRDGDACWDPDHVHDSDN